MTTATAPRRRPPQTLAQRVRSRETTRRWRAAKKAGVREPCKPRGPAAAPSPPPALEFFLRWLGAVSSDPPATIAAAAAVRELERLATRPPRRRWTLDCHRGR